MKKTAWRNRIEKVSKEVGTYRPEFDDVIDTLASILEKRDAIDEQYKAEGSIPVLAYTNKGGATNPTKNPLLILWADLNAQALTYWRDLGLTPAGLKKLNEKALEVKKKSVLGEALASLEL